MLQKTPSQDLNFEHLGYEVYKFKLDWTDEFVRENIDIIENNYSLFPNRNRWNCNCHVIHDNDFDVQHINYGFLRENYTKTIKDFCMIKNQTSRIDLSDIWYNYYKMGQYQEPHIHGKIGERGWTAVHYLIFDHKYHEPTKFTDPRIKIDRINSGDLLLFPLSHEHYVPENTSIFPRLTVAFGVIL
jgi:hypothetical protein